LARNIVLIGSDSIRADHCSCYGYGRETTPFLSSLAEKGVKFENPIVSGLATSASFMGIFTGDYSPIEASSIKPEVWRVILHQRITLAQVLSSNGYHTYGFNTNALLSRYYGFNKGFHHYFDGLRSTEGNHGWWWKVKKLSLLPFFWKLGIAEHILDLKNFLNADIGYAKTEDWIENILNTKLEEPYFLWAFLVDTHHPYVPPKEHARWGEIGTRKMVWLNYKMSRQGRGKIESGGNRWAMAQQKLEPKLSQKEHETIINGYDGEILHVDSIIKRLWEHLSDTNPIFIFHSDHGDGFGEHGFYRHPPEHYEYLIRVPLIIYNANRKGIVKEPVSFLRLAPTICELAEVDNEFSNPSLLDNAGYSPPIIENRIGDGFRLTVRDKEWKLITNPDRGDELYNLQNDPLESSNLIAGKGDIEKELRAFIDRHLRERQESDEKERARGRIRELKTQGKI
jgi:arylsulfatase A-like enzyme